jgi:two-component system chemotaxis response regulator CheB
VTAPRTFDAIVIGASAGGVEALSSVLPAIRPEYRGAVFVVVHVPRERPSLLAEIFAGKVRLQVREVEDKEPIAPGTIYFAPADYHLLIDDGPALALSTDAPVNFSRPSIDVLFESAADVYGARLLGLLLTGASRDGAAGLQAIHRRGGLTCVQDPDSAQAPLMPASAIRLGCVSHVLDLPALRALVHDLTAPAEAPPEGVS